MLVCAGAAQAQGRGFYGVGPQGALQAQDFEMMEEAGVGTLRFLVNWKSVPAAGDGYNFASLDVLIGSAAARGVRSLPFIYQRPPPRTSSQRAALAKFARAMAARYGRGGEFWQAGGAYELAHPGASPLPITAWQVLNEQNGRAYWGAKPSPKLYARALKSTARAIRDVDGQAEIVLGGMFGTPGGKGSMTSWKYLSRLYRVKGIKRAFSTVAVHPYGRNLKEIRFQIERIRKVMRRNGHRKAAVRVTELGWGSKNGGHHLNKGLQGQARMLKKSFRLLKRSRSKWKLKGVVWFSWLDGKVACKFCSSSGLLRLDRTRKPSFTAYKNTATG